TKDKEHKTEDNKLEYQVLLSSASCLLHLASNFIPLSFSLFVPAFLHKLKQHRVPTLLFPKRRHGLSCVLYSLGRGLLQPARIHPNRFLRNRNDRVLHSILDRDRGR